MLVEWTDKVKKYFLETVADNCLHMESIQMNCMCIYVWEGDMLKADL